MGITKLTGIILAAGEGKRAGGNKALLQIGGRRFIEIIADNLSVCGCNPIIAVVGAQSEEVKSVFQSPNLKYIDNENWERGQFSSLQKGLSELSNSIQAAIIALVDHPMVTKDTYSILCFAYLKNPEKIIIPTYGRKRGHPVIIPREIINQILAASENDSLRSVIEQNRSLIFEQQVNDPGILRDIDTDKDLKASN